MCGIEEYGIWSYFCYCDYDGFESLVTTSMHLNGEILNFLYYDGLFCNLALFLFKFM